MTAREATDAREWAANAEDSTLADMVATRDRSNPLYLAALTERNHRASGPWQRAALEGASVTREGCR